MVFSSVPLYLDPPNWHQQQQNQLQGSGGNDQINQHHLLPPPTAAQPPEMGGGGGSPGIRPNSMSERARLAKIPAPEAPLKCPRCDSTNTKFCYFNNYSLSQPRHFCKTCRRYWTRGGALRNVPVGGGCRRNKRSSSSASKSSTSGTTSGGGVASSAASKPPTSSLSSAGDFLGSGGFVMPPSGGGSMTSFMASLQNIAQLGMGNLGLTSFSGALHGIGGVGSSHHHDHHHSQLDNFNNGLFNNPGHQIVPSPSSFLGGFELPVGGGNNNPTVGGNLYSDHQQELVREGISTSKGNINPSSMLISSHDDSQFASVKMEDNGQAARLNLAKQLMGISSSNVSNNTNTNDNQSGNANQFWGANIGNVTNMWTDLSSLNSSSTTHLL